MSLGCYILSTKKLLTHIRFCWLIHHIEYVETKGLSHKKTKKKNIKFYNKKNCLGIYDNIFTGRLFFFPISMWKKFRLKFSKLHKIIFYKRLKVYYILRLINQNKKYKTCQAFFYSLHFKKQTSFTIQLTRNVLFLFFRKNLTNFPANFHIKKAEN